ncbi:MAG: cytochrome-c oxidase, cbb3-type subunit III [Pseudobdellovibrionaceae bacterium]
MSDDHKKEIDHLSGVETTGHEWDGLRELNNPAPRWWVWVYIACVVWAIWYFVIYPSWPIPGGHTEGTQGYTQFKELEASQAEIIARQDAYLAKFKEASFQQIMQDPELYAFAKAGGSAAFKDNCAQCHGTGAEGGKGYPNLNDDDWLWGGKIDDIHQTITYGIRSGHDEARISQMPSFGKDGLLNTEEVNAVVDYVLTLSGGDHQSTFDQGATVFQEQCAACHGEDGKGGQSVGAPNLTDGIWLYGGDRETVYETVFNARAGVMPTWKDRLSPDTIRQLAVYVHELGGGVPEEETVVEPAAQEITPAPAAEETSDVQSTTEQPAPATDAGEQPAQE